MDPQATWHLLLEAVASGDLDAAGTYARDLLHWLNRGGFPPTVHPELERVVDESSTLVTQLNRFVATTLCARVRLEAERKSL